MRIFGRIVAALLALALLIGSLLVVLEILLAGLGQPPLVIPYTTWYQGALQNPWSNPAIRLLCIGLIVAGFVVLYLALAARRPLGFPLKSSGSPVDAIVKRKSLEGSLGRSAMSVEGVSGARVRIKKAGTAQVSATTSRRVEGDLKERVQSAVASRLASLDLDSPTDVVVNLRTRGTQ